MEEKSCHLLVVVELGQGVEQEVLGQQQGAMVEEKSCHLVSGVLVYWREQEGLRLPG